ncbi:MAG: PaaI family thioesterase [Proteobacteria bacterium]|nr:PaaI family thioesterase [Pseudomonadota bacterium]
MYEHALFELAKNTPYYQHIGIEIVEAGDGFAKLVLKYKDCLSHPFGYFHGGVIASLADSSGINAVMTTLREGEKALTLEMKINFLLPAKNPEIYAEAKVVHRGRKIAVSDVDVKNTEGQLIAKAIVTCTITR